jgi:hypothetical protein
MPQAIAAAVLLITLLISANLGAAFTLVLAALPAVLIILIGAGALLYWLGIDWLDVVATGFAAGIWFISDDIRDSMANGGKNLEEMGNLPELATTWYSHPYADTGVLIALIALTVYLIYRKFNDY